MIFIQIDKVHRCNVNLLKTMFRKSSVNTPSLSNLRF